MKISYNRLKSYIDFNWTPAELAKHLTDSGLEVESMEQFESIKGGLKDVVIGKVLTKEKHPNADKLSLTTVDVGTGTPLQIVCGGPNVATGQTCVVALIGSTLYPTSGEPIEIKASKIRGEVSQGMICAEDELGLGNSHAGIIVIEEELTPGSPAADYFKVERDTILEIGLTPNRADAASHVGVARDVQALLSNLTEAKLVLPDVKNFRSQNDDLKIEVVVEDNVACVRYSGVSISGVTVKESPAWLKNFLRSIGLKSINNIVDATNFVLHELGQPLHAFDADKISGKKIIVKKQTTGTKFISLDGVERTLNGYELMICDDRESMCIAGVFGGINSGVSDTTTNVFLESACFNPVDIRKASKHHALKTDASFRFERGTDPNITVYALKRAALLIQEIAGGKISSQIVDIYPTPDKGTEVHLLFVNLFSVMGTKIETTVVEKIITGLDIQIQEDYFEGLKLLVPAFKVDVKREIDVIEEVMRIYGFNNIPLPKKLNASPVNFKDQERYAIREKISAYLTSNGFYELMTNSLTKSSQENLNDKQLKPIELLNPLSSDLNVLRTTMLFTTLEAAQYNNNRKNEDLKLFDFGKIYFSAGEKFIEENLLALLVTGNRFAESRFKYGVEQSFYFLKGIITNVLTIAGVSSLKETVDEQNENYSALISFSSGKKQLAKIGSLKKSLTKKFDLHHEVFYAEINFDALVNLAKSNSVTYKEVSKFPEVRRDLSMLIDKTVRYDQLEKLAYEAERKLLKHVNLFDVYEGKNLPENKKSYAIGFTLCDEEKTLQDKEIDKVMNKLMESFEKKLGAEIRK